MTRRLALATSLVLVATLAACTSGGKPHPHGSGSVSGSTPTDVPSRVTSSLPGAMPTRQPTSGTPTSGVRVPPQPGGASGCGTAPRSSGPLVPVARLTLTASRSSGSLTVTSAYVTTTSAERVVADPATSALLVVQGGRVVAAVRGGSGSGVPLLLAPGTKTPAQGLPRSVHLTNCATAAPLPPGRYSLVGVLGYGVDPLNSVPDGGMEVVAPTQAGTAGYVLVSAPVAVTV